MAERRIYDGLWYVEATSNTYAYSIWVHSKLEETKISRHCARRGAWNENLLYMQRFDNCKIKCVFFLLHTRVLLAVIFHLVLRLFNVFTILFLRTKRTFCDVFTLTVICYLTFDVLHKRFSPQEERMRTFAFLWKAIVLVVDEIYYGVK